ncbi:MAG: malonic semialdehyde reductase [Rhodospirillales bacterium]|nr:malonic semialdehyde reductase [Rhodospirillales bacterium]
MKHPLSTEALSTLFLEARTHNAWLDKPVPVSLLEEMWSIARMGPTSANCSPARIIFVQSDAAKQKLRQCLAEGNIDKTMAAPVTAIIGHDMTFFEKLPTLFPHADARAWFVGNDALIEETAFRNSTLQGAYLMLAARSLGLDCGPMSGFDKDKLNTAFFAGTTVRANFLCNIGYGDSDGLYPRGPRLAFAEACRVE